MLMHMFHVCHLFAQKLAYKHCSQHQICEPDHIRANGGESSTKPVPEMQTGLFAVLKLMSCEEVYDRSVYALGTPA